MDHSCEMVYRYITKGFKLYVDHKQKPQALISFTLNRVSQKKRTFRMLLEPQYTG